MSIYATHLNSWPSHIASLFIAEVQAEESWLVTSQTFAPGIQALFVMSQAQTAKQKWQLTFSFYFYNKFFFLFIF